MLVAEILHRSAGVHSERAAVWFEGAWRTYGELSTAATAFAALLRAEGIQPGERVAILLDNSFDYIVAHFGALTAGSVEVSLNTELKAPDLKTLLRDCEAAALVVGKKFASQCSAILGELPDLRLLITDWRTDQLVSKPAGLKTAPLQPFVDNAPPAPMCAGRVEGDLASIVYTSGSTGRPKGVMLSHLNLVSNAHAIVEYLRLRAEDRMLVVLPFHYIYGRSLLYTHLLSGGSIVIDNRFAYPVVVLKTMAELQVTCFAGVPSTFSILLRKTDAAKRKFPHLRLVTQAGGSMAPTLQKEVVEVFRPAELCVMYGSTEAAPRITFLDPELLPIKWGSIGRAIPGVEVIVADEQGQAVPRGTMGEVAAKGPNVMLGYWKDPEGTAAVLRDNFYFTGDLGYEDEDGCLFLTGRARDIIKAGGNRVGAKEIEDCLLELTEVVEAAVIGVPDEILGEAIKAFVVVHDPAITERHVREHLQRRLPAFKQPKHIEFTGGLPKNQAGKVMKAALRDREAAVVATRRVLFHPDHSNHDNCSTHS